MRTKDLPLLDFFEALRKNGFSLGVADYQLLLDALQIGQGLDRATGTLDKNKVERLCKLLWLKPNQSRFVFEQLFDEKVHLLQTQSTEEDKPDKDINEPLEQPKNTRNINEESEEEKQTENQREEREAKDFPLVKLVIGDASGERTDMPETPAVVTRRFFFSDNHFDLTKRQMQQVCRFLPHSQASLASQEIDIDATVKHFARMGWIGKPVFKRQERITNEVLLLIDHGGSMLAFDGLVRHFSSALHKAFQTRQEEVQKKIQQYYFYNVPQEYCYLNKTHTKYRKTADLLRDLHPHYASVIIVSDAGAARGGSSKGRFRSTLRFLIEMKEYTQKIAWLNPMPQARWKDTTAASIARLVPMFSLSSAHELQAAVNSLKGKF